MRKLLATIALLALSTQAHASDLGCNEIMNMVKASVPTSIVITTMKNAGKQFSQADITCLAEQGAPSDVIVVANELAATADAAPPTGGDPGGGEEPDEDVFVFNISGSKGQGVLTAECITIDADHEDVVSGSLRIPSGEVIDLFAR